MWVAIVHIISISQTVLATLKAGRRFLGKGGGCKSHKANQRHPTHLPKRAPSGKRRPAFVLSAAGDRARAAHHTRLCQHAGPMGGVDSLRCALKCLLLFTALL